MRGPRFRPALGSFVGREGEIDALVRLFASEAQGRSPAGARLVTVVGIGGVGKTRLVLEFSALSGAGAALVFCDLSEARTAEQVCACAARALGVELGASATLDDARARIGRAMVRRGPELLVVLDNFEQVVCAASETVGVWLALAPAARFLVTSRARLKLRGERVVDLLPLALPRKGQRATDAAAVRLFVDRSRAARDGFVLGAKDEATVAEIVCRLEGIPLAIELAAARAAVWTPAQLLQRMGKRFDVLTTGARDRSPRQATMRSTIDWSWSLLDDRARDALAAASLFRGGFTLEAAEAVLAGDPVAIADALQALHDSSLVHTYVSPELLTDARFAMYESVREYAAEKLSPETFRALSVRHAAYYLAQGALWTRASVGRDAAADSKRRALEEANLLAVAERAVLREPASAKRARDAMQALLALEPLYASRLPAASYATLIESALGYAERVPRKARPIFDRTRARAHLALGHARYRIGRTIDARAAYDDALVLARVTGDRPLMALALHDLGTLDHAQGHLQRGSARFEEIGRAHV